MQVHGTTDVGRQRSENQDTIYYGLVDEHVLAVVADGMGGHAGGALASELAVESFVEAVEARFRNVPRDELFETAAGVANEAVHDRAQGDSALENMGTTLVGALVSKPDDADAATCETTLVNVGDSRAYEVGDDFEQLTVDQSLVQELVEAGDLDPEQAADHPSSNVLSQALGTDPTVEPDWYHRELEGALLLCSDGLTDELPDETIRDVVDDVSSEDAPVELVARANEAGGSDNISVVIVAGGSE